MSAEHEGCHEREKSPNLFSFKSSMTNITYLFVTLIVMNGLTLVQDDKCHKEERTDGSVIFFSFLVLY